MRKLNFKKVLFGLSLSLVLAMAVGSFAIGEMQTPTAPQATEPQVAAANNGDTGEFTVTGGTKDTDYSYLNGELKIHPQSSDTEITVKNTNLDPEVSTGDRIVIESGPTDTNKTVKIKLAGVNIDTDGGAALEIEDNASFNVNITLADDSENTLTATADGYAGLQKNGDSGVGMLTITGSTGENAGKLEATGGENGAGIGGGYMGSGSAITISGGTVTANGGTWAAGIGGGYQGSGTDITISGGVVEANEEGFGAGIGGGYQGSGTDITISGGKVTANGGYGGAGIGSSDDMGIGKNGDRITITGGHVIAYGGATGAGIGGGGEGEGNNITITGGVVEAYGGEYLRAKAPAGIGGGFYGSATGNSISGNAVVMATSGLEGVEALPNCTIDNGIVFKGYGNDFDDDDYGRATSFVWNDGEMNGNVSLAQDVEIPTNLTIPAGSTLSVGEGKTLTVPAGSVLTNDGTLTINGTLSCAGTGKVTTKTDFYREGETTVYKTGYQTYQTSEGVQKYKDLPNPDDPDPANEAGFIGWYYLDKDGNIVMIDNTKEVLLNQHDFDEYRANVYKIEVGDLENGQIKLDAEEVAEGLAGGFEVIPDEGYQLKEGSLKVTANGKDVEVTEKDGKYTFKMPGGDVTITATFEPIPEPTPTPPTPTPPGPEPTPTPPGPEPGPEPEPTPDPSVNPDGGDGSGSSSKTSDPFMGGIALALLGVATTGAVLVRKRK